MGWPSRMTRPVNICMRGCQPGHGFWAGRNPVGAYSGDGLGVEHGHVDGARRHAESLSDPVDVYEPLGWWQGDDDGSRISHCRLDDRGAPVAQGWGEAGVENGVGKAARSFDGHPQRDGAVAVEEVGGIESIG